MKTNIFFLCLFYIADKSYVYYEIESDTISRFENLKSGHKNEAFDTNRRRIHFFITFRPFKPGVSTPSKLSFSLSPL